MAELKTKKTNASVEKFIRSIADPARRRDCRMVIGLMRKATRSEPKMWGSSIVGFGSYRYVYASGREGDWPLTGFSPRKQNLTIYIMSGFSREKELMKALGRHRTGKSCLYLRSLADIDLPTLEKLIRRSVERMKKQRAA